MNIFQFKNFLSLATAEALSKLATFVAFAYLAHKLGPAGFGFVEWSGAILMCASLFVDQGFSSYGAREIAKTPDRTAALVSEIVTVRLLLAIGVYASVSLFALLWVTDPVVRNLILVFGLSLFILPFLLQWVFQAHERMHLVAFAQIARQLIFASTILIFVREFSDIILVGAAEVAAVCVSAGLSLILFVRLFPAHRLLRPALSWETIRSGGTIGLSQLFWVVRMFGATLIVGLIATATETGVFGAAMRIFVAAHTFVWLYFFNLLPSLSRAWHADKHEFVELLRNSMRIVVSIGAPLFIVGFLTAPFLMTTVYGADFLPGYGALRWLGLACFLTAISGHFRFGLIAAGHQSREMISSAFGSVALIVLLPVGYFTGGITFAALGLCIAEFLIMVVSWAQSRTIFSSQEAPLNDRPDAKSVANFAQSVR